MINSEEYWNDRFKSGSWDEFGGQEQNMFFNQLAIDHLPNWIIQDIEENDLSIIDVGCAQGSGTNLLKKTFSRSKVVGVDFSKSAIDTACSKYSACEFECKDIKELEDKYDIVFSSNVLEHLQNPFEELERLVKLADKYFVLLLPFQEEELHKEHFIRFDYSSFTNSIDDYYLCYYKAINTANMPGSMWPGKQILLVYTKDSYISRNKIKLSKMHNQDFERKEQLELQLVESKKVLEDKNLIINQQNKEIRVQKETIEQQKEVVEQQKRTIEEKGQIINNQEILVQAQQIDLKVHTDRVTDNLNVINSLKEVNADLVRELDDIEEKISQAKETTLDLTNTKMFKLVHLAYRVKHQLLKGNISDKRLFFKWLKERRNKRQAIQDHSFNPMFQIVQQLEQINIKIDRDICYSTNAESIMPEELKQVLPETSQIKNILESQYKKFDILFLSVIDYDFRYQRPQHLANAFSKQGHRVFYINANFNNDKTQEVKSIDNINVISMKSNRYATIHTADYVQDSNDVNGELEKIIVENGIRDCLIVVQYPTWVQGVQYLKDKYGFKVITDYLDDYTGFEDTNIGCLASCCYQLLECSDRVIASSNYLQEVAHKYNNDVKVVRNGTEFECFHKAYTENKEFSKERKLVGYYGAIAHWFDFEKVTYLAENLPQVDIVLIGEVTEGKELLKKYANIKLLGEKPYAKLPGYLKNFDVCLIPFDTSTDLIKATNPVKFYEYLSAAKKVVATEIPELMPFKDKYVYLSNDNKQFLDYVKLCLNGEDTLAKEDECLEFAKENDWIQRGNAFIEYAKEVFPKVSIIVLTYNQLDYTKECIQSILDKTAYPNYELIIVDNDSSDDTPAYLNEIEAKYSGIKVILNRNNVGFAAGNNIGLEHATGEYVVLLNNDTVVTRGWITGLVKHFIQNNKLGIVGPVTNSIGNEAKINVSYNNIKDMESFAYEYTKTNMNKVYDDIGVLAMFCIMISREAYSKIGGLEQLYGVGMFEDDDYSYKAKSLGFDLICAEDVFIHHYGSVSFKKLEDKTYLELFNKNKSIFEERWNVKWKPHKYRPGVK